MKRQVKVAMLSLAAAALLCSQAPAGWKMRVDRSTAATDPDASGSIKFVTMGTGFHATNPQAAVYWNPANKAIGHVHAEGHVYADEAQRPHELLRLGVRRKRPGRRAAEVSVLRGGAGRDVADQEPRRRRDHSTRGENGERRGEEAGRRRKIDQCAGSARRRGQGRLRGERHGGAHSMPKSGAMAKTDGIYGIRINHLLEVHIDGLAVTK